MNVPTLAHVDAGRAMLAHEHGRVVGVYAPAGHPAGLAEVEVAIQDIRAFLLGLEQVAFHEAAVSIMECHDDLFVAPP